ncbi:MAG: right-handed parallel beta-helix repeat-containing protein [Rhizomicrobium sp.]
MAKLNLRLAAIALVAAAAPAVAQLPPAPQIPRVEKPLLPGSKRIFSTIRIPNRPAPVPIVIYVSPQGNDDADGSAQRPFRSLLRAQAAVRMSNRDHDIAVQIADGTYRLDAPLRFTAEDGGHSGFTVRWEGAEGPHPVISGGIPVTGWRIADERRGIWSAAIPAGADPRQLIVDGRLPPRAAIEVSRRAFEFRDWGLEIVDPAWRFLADLPDQRRIEVEGTGWFTDRKAMVDRIEGTRVLMQQPGWRNNLIGYDTIARPVSLEAARLFFSNSLAFLREPGQWFADPAKGLLYYKPRPGEDIAAISVELPRLQSLLSIAGSYDHPVSDLQFRRLSFQSTSWLGPSGPDGYASQQSGSFLAGQVPGYPADPIRDCSWGCWPFEGMRNRWRQQPAAVQVAAATRVVFDEDRFSALGQVALGIGNNPDANDSGIGLGATAVEVTRSSFTDLAGGAIMVGGVIPDAHHPSRPEMAVRDILIRNNRISGISRDYREQAAILVTYATGAVIMNNDVSDAPYDGIDLGWGWGANDPGGSPAYRTANRGYYDQPGNLTYDTPTILRDTVVVANRVSRVKQWYPDGGAIYHLSADPGALIAENYIRDVPGGIALYLDEGSRYVTLRNNVVENVGVWLNLNSQDWLLPRRTALDNSAIGNWYNSGQITGSWTKYLNNNLVGNVAVKGNNWPAAARHVITKSGVRPQEPKQ